MTHHPYAELAAGLVTSCHQLRNTLGALEISAALVGRIDSDADHQLDSLHALGAAATAMLEVVETIHATVHGPRGVPGNAERRLAG